MEIVNYLPSAISWSGGNSEFSGIITFRFEHELNTMIYEYLLASMAKMWSLCQSQILTYTSIMINNSNLPKIIISYNRFLDPIFVFYCKHNPELKKSGWNDWIPPSVEEIKERVKNYREEWQKFGDKILKAVCDITGLSFQRDAIDVFVVSGNPRPFSHPIIVKSMYSPFEFVDVIAHEIIHQLFSQNFKKLHQDFFHEMFPKETNVVSNHVIVDAILKYIYLDVLNDEKRLIRNIENSKKHSTSDYSCTWEIVKKVGYKELINQFKDKIKC